MIIVILCEKSLWLRFQGLCFRRRKLFLPFIDKTISLLWPFLPVFGIFLSFLVFSSSLQPTNPPSRQKTHFRMFVITRDDTRHDDHARWHDDHARWHDDHARWHVITPRPTTTSYKHALIHMFWLRHFTLHAVLLQCVLLRAFERDLG
jgi:hypothetical protein